MILDYSHFINQIKSLFAFDSFLCESDEFDEIRWEATRTITHEEVGMQRGPSCSAVLVSLESHWLYECSCWYLPRWILEEAPTTISLWLLMFSEIDIINITSVFFYFFREIKYSTDDKEVRIFLEKRMSIRKSHIFFWNISIFSSSHIIDIYRNKIGLCLETKTSSIPKYCSTNRARKSDKTMPYRLIIIYFKRLCYIPYWFIRICTKYLFFSIIFPSIEWIFDNHSRKFTPRKE